MERETMTLKISIHTLRMEGDLQAEPVICPGGISIHTLRMEGDPSGGASHLPWWHLNPHPPHGG